MNYLSTYNSKSFTIRDEEGKEKRIEANDSQKILLDEMIALDDQKFEDPEYNVHQLWHSIPYENDMGAYEYGCLIEKWAADKPEVKIFYFDDEMFMSSVGFIIPSMSKYEHMGVNVILCPQCAKNSTNFFCYPNHLASLLKAFGASETELLSVPARDNSSPLFLRRERLKNQLLESCQNSI